MPFVDGKYIEFNAEALADAFAAGKELKPDYFDFEDAKTRETRINQELERIDRVIFERHPKIWRKLRGMPDRDLEERIFDDEWKAAPGIFPGGLAKTMLNRLSQSKKSSG